MPRTSAADDASDDHTLAIRCSPIYGVDTDAVTTFLMMMRTLPAVPVLDDSHAVQPLWHQDLADAVAAALALDSSVTALDIAGPDVVTHDELYEHIARLIDRRPLRIPVPQFLAEYGAKLTEGLRLPSAVNPGALALSPFDVTLPPDRNALSQTLGVTPTSLDQGLTRLIHELGELTPAEGTGGLDVKRFSARIRDAACDAPGLLRAFRRRFADLMPLSVGVEPAAPATELRENEVVTMALPGRGHVQVRVEEVTDEHVIVATLRGHAVAGVVRFSARADGGFVRFEVMTCDRAANAVDWLVLTLGGARLQDANWSRLVQNVVDLSGGQAEEIGVDHIKPDDEEAERLQRWIEGTIERRTTQAMSDSGAPR